MTLISMVPDWLFILFGLVFLYAAASDIAKRKIPNAAVIALIIGAVVAVVLEGFDTSLWENAAMFAIILAVGTFAFSRGWFGGGDVKLLAATALWFDMADGLRMIVSTAVVGGLVTLVMLMARVAFKGKDREMGRLVPYGVAIGLGAVGTGLWLRG
ncbi:A24 family peptidase [Sphingomicrobium aestuariivivum]|uniref:A24 family peptidase n=1 Tax=Sphingomicrobium aestuariivivum TaxID=1582356 RepID=UPI001FD71334|nr:prepilin peptidase [Sphingomicrobium aestuariivivum]MCJ8191035.1 prepilin peptidase [Sphingomicrobium aestuariivivum]